VHARENIKWWETELEHPLGGAPFGENLTVRGVPVSEAVIGEQWAVGSALLQVAPPPTEAGLLHAATTTATSA
jgi:MOSC domain-containing protein YiiM